EVAMQEYQLTGDVVFRGQSGYAEARREFNPRFDYFPEVIVFCRNTADVQNAVRWARKRGVPIRLRCGRHSYEAYSTADNAIVIEYWQQWAKGADRRVTAILKCTAPSSGSFATIGQFVGPQSALTAIIQGQLLMGQPKVSIQTMPYIEAIRYFAGLKDQRYSH